MPWRWMLAGFALLAAWLLAEALASSLTLSQIASGRLVLEKDGRRVPLWMPDGGVQPAGVARLAGLAGATLGHRSQLVLPDGEELRCRHLPWAITCGNGWQGAVR